MSQAKAIANTHRLKTSWLISLAPTFKSEPNFFPIFAMAFPNLVVAQALATKAFLPEIMFVLIISATAIVTLVSPRAFFFSSL